MNENTDLITAAKNEERVIKCSLIDKQLKGVSVSSVFFFDGAVPAKDIVSALRKALTIFPVFSGRIESKDSELVIRCNNHGVVFNYSEDETTLETALNKFNDTNGSQLINELDASQVTLGKSPLLSLKISYFSCGGMAIGASWNHAIGDMNSFMHFMRIWGAICSDKYSLSDEPIICDSRDEYLQQSLSRKSTAEPTVRFLRWLDILNLVGHQTSLFGRRKSVAFYFSREEIIRIQKDFSDKAGMKLSANDVVCAHISSVLLDEHPSDKIRYLSLAVDFREKENLPKEVFGNLLSSINLQLKHSEPPFSLAARIRKAVDRFSEEHMDYFANYEYWTRNSGRKILNQLVPKALDPSKGNILITNWSNQSVCDVQFGNQKPFLMLPAGKVPFPWIAAVVNGFDGKGLVFYVTLPQEIVNKFSSSEVLGRVHKYEPKGSRKDELAYRVKWFH